MKWADSTVNGEDHGYLYDSAWNLSKRTNNASTDTFSVDSKNQYASGPGGTFTYDDNGNLTYYGQTGENENVSKTCQSSLLTLKRLFWHSWVYAAQAAKRGQKGGPTD